MKKSFFEINNELDQIFAVIEDYCIENETDEIPDLLIENLILVQDQMTDKIQDYKSYINYLNGNIEGIDRQIKDLQNAKNRFKNRIERLKTLVIESVNRFGDENKSGNKSIKILTGNVTVTKSKSVEVIDIDQIDNDFKTKITEIKIDKKRILKLLKEGVEVEGCQLKISESIRGL